MVFSEQGFWQELVAIGITAAAAMYLLARLTGWSPRRAARWLSGAGVADSREASIPVTAGRRLARGLAKAQRRRSTEPQTR